MRFTLSAKKQSKKIKKVLTRVGRRRDLDFCLFRVMHRRRRHGHGTRAVVGVGRLVVVRGHVVAVGRDRGVLRLRALVVVVITVVRVVRPAGRDGTIVIKIAGQGAAAGHRRGRVYAFSFCNNTLPLGEGRQYAGQRRRAGQIRAAAHVAASRTYVVITSSPVVDAISAGKTKCM